MNPLKQGLESVGLNTLSKFNNVRIVNPLKQGLELSYKDNLRNVRM